MRLPERRACTPAPGAPPSTWLSTWNWISSSMLATLHTLTLPSSLHVAQWDSLGLKTTSFTCEEAPPYLRPTASQGATPGPHHSRGGGAEIVACVCVCVCVCDVYRGRKQLCDYTESGSLV